MLAHAFNLLILVLGTWDGRDGWSAGSHWLGSLSYLASPKPMRDSFKTQGG